jgi:hypothetical protein
MTRYGYFLSSEEYEPASLIEQARMAEKAGFDALDLRPLPPLAGRAGAVELFTGELVTHRGTHYEVDTARLYSLPSQPPPIHRGTGVASDANRWVAV